MGHKTTLILILGILIIGTSYAVETQIRIHQINQTDGVKFNESVIPDNFTTLKNFSGNANISLLNVTNPVVFAVSNTTPSGNLVDSVFTKAAYEFVDIDTYSGFNLANASYTIPISGWYLITIAEGFYNGTTDGKQGSGVININGVAQSVGIVTYSVTGTTVQYSFGHTVKHLNASDVIWVTNLDNSGTGFVKLYASASKSVHVFKGIKIA